MLDLRLFALRSEERCEHFESIENGEQLNLSHKLYTVDNYTIYKTLCQVPVVEGVEKQVQD